MKRTVSIGLSVIMLFLAASTVFAASNQQMIAEAKQAVRAKLKDPESARFQNLRVENVNGEEWVMGECNAKNAFGGYVGFKEFAYDTGKKIALFKRELRELSDSRPWALLLYDDLFGRKGR